MAEMTKRPQRSLFTNPDRGSDVFVTTLHVPFPVFRHTAGKNLAIPS